QLYVACQNGKVEQALSLGFLLCWLAGDVTNFIGCYLTDQLPIQPYFSFVFQGGMNTKYSCIAWVLICLLLCLILPTQLLMRNNVQNTILGSNEFQRRSTDGTSYLLFALAMIGNGTYGLSLVLKMPATQYLISLYFWHHLPWFIGSFGVLLLDIFVSFSNEN
ncbi:PQ-loop repeat-containing protein 2, partial [Ophiophagus hannah]